MEITTYLKLAIMLLGTVATLSFLIPGLKNNDNLKKSRAGLLFVCTCVLVLLVSIIEFAIYYKF